MTYTLHVGPLGTNKKCQNINTKQNPHTEEFYTDKSLLHLYLDNVTSWSRINNICNHFLVVQSEIILYLIALKEIADFGQISVFFLNTIDIILEVQRHVKYAAPWGAFPLSNFNCTPRVEGPRRTMMIQTKGKINCNLSKMQIHLQIIQTCIWQSRVSLQSEARGTCVKRTPAEVRRSPYNRDNPRAEASSRAPAEDGGAESCSTTQSIILLPSYCRGAIDLCR